MTKNGFLQRYIFVDLENINTGFDSPSIYYFSADDFRVVLERSKQNNIKILGIEPWLNGTFYDVITFEAYKLKANDPNWYEDAFKRFFERDSNGKDLQYSATYEIPAKLLK